MTSEVDNLSQRVARLERQNRQLKMVGLGIALGMATFLLVGAAAFLVAGAAVFLIAVVAMDSSFVVKGCPRPLPLGRHRLAQRYKSSGWAPAYQYRHEDATSKAIN